MSSPHPSGFPTNLPAGPAVIKPAEIAWLRCPDPRKGSCIIPHPLEPQPATDLHGALLPYVADLEFEVDRLRRHAHVIRQEALALARAVEPVGGKVTEAARHLVEVLRDLQDPPGYHPAHDQVVAIAVRPLVEMVFRWQQRLLAAPDVALRLEFECEYVEWFPARLRHVLDALLSNALRYRDPAKSEAWVLVSVRAAVAAYELRVCDNGLGMQERERGRLFDLIARAGPVRAAVPGVGLAVIKLLVEQSGGTLNVESAPGGGSAFTATLPRYDVDDFIV
jgi:signal transduction histidine kinase